MKWMISAVVAALALPANAQNLLANGSFEQGPAPNSPYGYLNVEGTSTDIVGWYVLGDSVDYISSNLWLASDGDYSVDLNGNPGIGGVAQSFLTTTGSHYRVQFDLSGNPDGDTGVRSIYVSAGDQELNYYFDTTGHTHADMGWTTHAFQFIAQFDESTVSFYSTTDDQEFYGPVIDNIVVEATCAADFNNDGFMDIFDFNDFVTCFEGGDCPENTSADYNADGFVDIFDFEAFVTDFESGC